MRRWHPLNQSLYLGYKIHLAGLLITQKGDRVAMANSVEARYPFLDEDVIAFASRLHPRWKLHGLRGDKYLLRQAAARLLPEAVAQRKKAMFRAPLAETFLVKPPSFVRDLISPDSRTHRLFRCRRDRPRQRGADERRASSARLRASGSAA